MIDPRQLTHLLAIEEHGSFSRAAESLRVSQPALSNSIALLERRLGVTVLTRSPRGATVNDIGRQLARRARELRSVMDGAVEDVRQRKLGLAGPVNIGATPVMGELFMPELVSRMNQAGFGASLTILEARDDRLAQGLLDRELDLVLAEVLQGPSDPQIEEEFLLEDPFFLGVGVDSPLADRDEIDLAEVMSHAWVLPLPGGTAYTDIGSVFRAASVGWPTNVIHTNSLAVTKRLIGNSMAIGMITGLVHAGWQSNIRRLTVTAAAPRKLGVKQRVESEPSEVARKTLALIREVAASFERGELTSRLTS